MSTFYLESTQLRIFLDPRKAAFYGETWETPFPLFLILKVNLSISVGSPLYLIAT